jgi:choline dehydrogenase
MMRTGPAMMLRGKNFFSPSLRKAIRAFFRTLFLLSPVNNFISKIYGLVVILGKPVSRGSIRLSSCNVEDPAVIDLAYYQDDTDLETMINGVKVAQRIANQAGLVAWGNKALIPDSMSQDTDKLKTMIHKLSMTTFHYCGTCAMGNNPDAPVDTKLKLKDFEKIRIADASVIPVVPVSALNAPSMMIGYRLVDFILDERSRNYHA